MLILWVIIKLPTMDNPFDLIDRRLQAIEGKLDGLIQKTGNKNKSSTLSITWITTKLQEKRSH